MIDRDDIKPKRSKLSRDEVRDLLLEAWRRRPENERNPLVAKRFALKAAEEFPFECERPRENVILAWLRPWVVTPEEPPPEGPIRNWVNRPWFKRSVWPLRILLIVLIGFLVMKTFAAFGDGDPGGDVTWIFTIGPVVLILAMLWVERRPGR